MSISKSGCSKSITKTDLDYAYKQGFADCAKILDEYKKELQVYKDKEEQGLLIELPVAEGSEVWTIMCGITGKNPTLFRDDFELAMLKHWGTAVFATRSEAEEALAKMGGK